VELPERIAASHILVQYVGSAGAIGVVRSRDEAFDIAAEALESIQAGNDFRRVANEVSDDGSARRGGWLGVGTQDRWVPEFSATAFRLEIGEVSQPVETKFGWHVIRREVDEGQWIKHIVVRHKDVVGKMSPEFKHRSRGEARELADAARARVTAGEDFEAVAKEMSDGPYGVHGGDLGEFLPGELGPVFDENMAPLEVGDVSDVFESPSGFHIVLRYE